jgi:hypothetical protein
MQNSYTNDHFFTFYVYKRNDLMTEKVLMSWL